MKYILLLIVATSFSSCVVRTSPVFYDDAPFYRDFRFEYQRNYYVPCEKPYKRHYRH